MTAKTFTPMILALTLFSMACSAKKPVTVTPQVLGAIEKTSFESPKDDYVVELIIDEETGHLLGYVFDGTEEDIDEYTFPKQLEPVQFTAGFSLENDLILTGLYTPLGTEAVITITAVGFDFHEVTPIYANWE